MLFNVAQLLKETSGSARAYTVDEAVEPIGETQVDCVNGVVKLMKTHHGIWLSAALNVNAVSTCGRCLEEYSQPLHLAIEEEYFPIIDPLTGTRPVELDESGNHFEIDERNILDLTEAVRQYSELNVPMKPICQEDCRGICLYCGVNLNHEPCRCDSPADETRMSALLKLALGQDKTENHS